MLLILIYNSVIELYEDDINFCDGVIIDLNDEFDLTDLVRLNDSECFIEDSALRLVMKPFFIGIYEALSFMLEFIFLFIFKLVFIYS